jgi:hypothetical protein
LASDGLSVPPVPSRVLTGGFSGGSDAVGFVLARRNPRCKHPRVLRR